MDIQELILQATEEVRQELSGQIEDLKKQVQALQEDKQNLLDKVTVVPPHYHNGNENTRTNSSDLEPYQIVSTAPTENTIEGTIKLYVNGTTYKLYVFLNKAWRSVTLT